MIRKIKFASFKTQPDVLLSVILKLCAAVLLLIFLAAGVSAQGSGSSVFIYNKATPGTQAKVVADFLADQIGKGLLNEYPCIDWLDDASMRAIIGWERMGQILGAEPNDDTLQNLAGALGARYIIVVTSTTLPNGQTTVSAKVLDSQTGRVIANRMETGADPESSLDNAASVAKSIMQDLASVFKNQCEPHWTGTITITYNNQKAEKKTKHVKGGGDVINIKTDSSESRFLENKIQAFLQPMSLGTEGTKKTMARVIHTYEYRFEYIISQSSTVRCRPRGSPSHWLDTSGKNTEIEEEYGHNTETLPVYIYVSETTGKYEITVEFPEVAVKRNEERNYTGSGCDPKPFSVVTAGEGGPESQAYAQSGSTTLRGQIDPKNPNSLSGQEVTGDLEIGQTTMTWSLQLVKPKTKK